MALTKGRVTQRRTGDAFVYPVAAGVNCFCGGLAVLDAAGRVKPGVTATGLISVGRFSKDTDNTTGAAGDVTAEVESGVFKWKNSAAADLITIAEIGDLCYIVDDETVAKTSATNTRSVAGRVVDLDALGVWVKTGFDAT